MDRRELLKGGLAALLGLPFAKDAISSEPEPPVHRDAPDAFGFHESGIESPMDDEYDADPFEHELEEPVELAVVDQITGEPEFYIQRAAAHPGIKPMQEPRGTIATIHGRLANGQRVSFRTMDEDLIMKYWKQGQRQKCLAIPV